MKLFHDYLLECKDFVLHRNGTMLDMWLLAAFRQTMESATLTSFITTYPLSDQPIVQMGFCCYFIRLMVEGLSKQMRGKDVNAALSMLFAYLGEQEWIDKDQFNEIMKATRTNMPYEFMPEGNSLVVFVVSNLIYAGHATISVPKLSVTNNWLRLGYELLYIRQPLVNLCNSLSQDPLAGQSISEYSESELSEYFRNLLADRQSL